MSEDVPDKPIEDVSSEDSEDAVAAPTEENETVLAETPKVTFRGNAYDLISMGSLASAALILFTCVTCGMGYYCLPVLSLVLGAIGVLSARQAVDVGRTRLWSWLGVAGGGILLLLMAVCFVLYVAFIAIAAISGGQQWGY